jgi:hypothetical protein
MPNYLYSWNNPIPGCSFWIDDTLIAESVVDAVVIEDTRFHFMFTLLESLGYIFNVSKIEEVPAEEVSAEEVPAEEVPAEEVAPTSKYSK